MTTEPDRPGILQVISSVLSAAIGVQSARNRERDFTKGSPARYVVIGVVATALFVLTMYTIVRIVLKNAGI